MRNFIYRLLGWECCGDFSKWETHSGNFSRLSDPDIDGFNAYGYVSRIEYTKRWQERHCESCGKIQQRKLKQ